MENEKKFQFRQYFGIFFLTVFCVLFFAFCLSPAAYADEYTFDTSAYVEGQTPSKEEYPYYILVNLPVYEHHVQVRYYSSAPLYFGHNIEGTNKGVFYCPVNANVYKMTSSTRAGGSGGGAMTRFTAGTVDGVETSLYYTDIEGACDSSTGEPAIINSNYNVGYCKNDSTINTSSPEFFFQIPGQPLAEVVGTLTTAGGQQTLESLTDSLGFLVPCGIGCLALLIGVALLPKVLYKFL